ncbi:MAG: hypothetical protein HUJ26_17790 [Planctomycetaceae bacterium]|nr:hypothetical protein [Planctomycetaceae bacterium]
MKTNAATFLTIAGLALAWTASTVEAQHVHRRYQPRYSGGAHIDHHDHVVRDSHGHVVQRHHHDVIHPNSTHVVPHFNTAHAGSYYSHGGRSYYYPQRTASADPHGQQVHTAAKPVQMQFGGFSQVDDLASRLETLTNELCLDLHFNYSHNHGFRETYAEAYQILDVAKYIHAAEHQRDRDAIASKLGGLDELFHHIQDDVRGWSRHHHRQVGSLGILTKMDYIESTLHHLMNDVGVRQSGVNAGNGQALPPGGPANGQAPPPAGSGFQQSAPSNSPTFRQAVPTNQNPNAIGSPPPPTVP